MGGAGGNRSRIVHYLASGGGKRRNAAKQPRSRAVSETGQDLTVGPPAALEPSAAMVPAQAATDAELVAMWLHGRGPATTRAYAADATSTMSVRRCER